MSKIDKNAQYEEILNPPLRVRLRNILLYIARSFTVDIYGHPISDEIIIQTLQEEIRVAEGRSYPATNGMPLTEIDRDLQILDRQLSACERAIEEAVKLQKRFALRYALYTKDCFEMRRTALTTKRL